MVYAGVVKQTDECCKTEVRRTVDARFHSRSAQKCLVRLSKHVTRGRSVTITIIEKEETNKNYQLFLNFGNS